MRKARFTKRIKQAEYDHSQGDAAGRFQHGDDQPLHAQGEIVFPENYPDYPALNGHPAKGMTVRIKSSGREGTVVGAVAGYTMVKAEGGTKALAYLSSEIEPIEVRS